MSSRRKEYKILKKETQKVEKIESRLLFRSQKKADKIGDNPGFIRSKIPEKTYLTLEKAFEKAFKLIFEKGSNIIEKTGKLEKIRNQSELYEESMERMVHEGTIKAVDKLASGAGTNSKLIGTADGSLLGIAGMGMPDIPIFLSILLKTCYEIAAGYGIDYRNPKEKKFTINLLKMAFSNGDDKIYYSRKCDEIAEQMYKISTVNNDEMTYFEITDEDLEEVSRVLATDMLVAKFLQGFTFFGVVGGIFNYRLVHKVTLVAKIKYKKRFLERHIHRLDNHL